MLEPIVLYKMTNPNEIENNIEKLLLNNFPRYIPYREKYLIPLRGLPSNPNWRFDSHPFLEQIGVTSYGILKSINFIQHRKEQIKIADFDQSFKNIYFHFGLIFDCIEYLSRNIVSIKQILGLISLESKLKLSKQKLTDDFIDWIGNQYDKKFFDLINKGKPIFYYPQKDNNYLSLIIKNPAKRTFNKFATTIKNYRNFFIHNPGVDVFIDKVSDQLYAIKKEYVDATENWSNLQMIFEMSRDYFEQPIEMINHDLKTLLSNLNLLWDSIDKELESIYSHKDFGKLFKGYDRQIQL